MNSARLLSLLRIALGFVFLWACIDKVFGLGFSTSPDKSWLSGVSPTAGFLQFGTDGFLSTLFANLAGIVIVDWLFMLGLLGVGMALILGMGIKIAGYAGALLMFLIYLPLFPPQNNPLIDQHIIYILILLYFASDVESSAAIGLGQWWGQTKLVEKFPLLR